MKIIIDRDAFMDTLNTVGGAIQLRTPKPQLACFLLRASKDGAGTLEVIGTDAEVTLRQVLMQVDVLTPGEALIPADKLKTIVAAQDGDNTLTLEMADDVLHIKGGDAHFKVFGYPANDYPPVLSFDEACNKRAELPIPKQVAIPAATITRLLDQTTFAVARETSRYAINGVMLTRDKKNVAMVATDGRRLALSRATLASDDSAAKDGSGAPIKSCIISTKAAGLMRKLIHVGDDAPVVRIAVSDTQIHVCQGGTELTASLVEGSFPPYQDVLPKDSDKKATLPREAFASAMRRAALLTSEESRGVKLAFSGSTLQISSRTAEVGEASVQMTGLTYEGEALEIGFNPGFLIDVCKVIHAEQITLHLKASNKPGLLTTTDFSYVVMPVSLV